MTAPTPHTPQASLTPVHVILGRSSDTAPNTPSRWPLILFAGAVLLGILIGGMLRKPGYFFTLLIFGLLIWVGARFLSRLSATNAASPAQREQSVLAEWQPQLARLRTVGWDNASEGAKACLKALFRLQSSHPELFTVSAATLEFSVERLLQMADLLRLLGDPRELRRKHDRLQSKVSEAADEAVMAGDLGGSSSSPALLAETSDILSRLEKVEKVQASALALTKDLQKLRHTLESALLEKATGQDFAKAQSLLAERVELEKRVSAELQAMGL